MSRKITTVIAQSSVRQTRQGRRPQPAASATGRNAAARLALALALGVVVGELSPMGMNAAQAASSSWTGAVSTDWNNPNNWSNNTFPTGAFPDGVLTVNTNTGNIATITANSAFTPSDVNVGVGSGNSGQVNQIAGSFAGGSGNWGFIGCNGGTGVYNLADTTTTGSGVTGFGIGSGSLTIGGNLYTGGRYFDPAGTGTLNVNTTGFVQAGLVDFGDGQNGTGTGTGNLDNGTVRSTGEMWVGAWNQGTFNQAGGTATSASWLAIGRSGTGVYNLTGGTVNAATGGGNITVGSFGGANGTVNASGGTFGTPNAFYVGEGGTGTLNVLGSALVSVGNATNGLRLGVNSGASGTVNLNGGTILTPIVTQGSGSGTFNFNGGILKAAASNSTFMTGLAAANVRNAPAVIDSNGFNITIGQALQHSAIAGDSATDGGLSKQGGGGLTLTASNSFNGNVTVNGGSLIVGGTGDVNSSAGILVNGSGAKFVSTSSTAVTPTVTVTNGGVDGTGTINTVNIANSAGNTVSNGNGGTGTLTIGSLTFAGAGNFSLNVAATTPEVVATSLSTSGSGNVLVNASNASWLPGTYDLIGYSTLSGSGFGAFAKGTISGLSARQTATLSNPAGFIALTIAGDNPKWTGAANSNWTTAAQSPPKNWQLISSGTSTDYINGDVVLFDDTASNTTVNISDANVTPTSTTFNNANKNYTLNGPFGIAGSGSLTKSGSGTLTINSPNTYSGGTTINGGAVNLNNASALGTGPVNITAAAALDNTSGSAVTLSTNNAQTWGADLTVGGSNALNMGSGAVTLTSDRTVTVNGNAGFTVTGSIGGGAFGLTKAGSGSLLLGGNNSYGGATVVQSGTLTVNGNNTGTGTTIVNTGTLNVTGGTTGSAGADVQLAPNSTDTATLNITGGTLNANRVALAGASANNTSPGTAVINQSGGTINSHAWFTVGSGGNTAGNAGGVGTYNLSGGTLNLFTQQLEIGNFTGASGTVNMSGTSAINVYNNNNITLGANNNAAAATFTQNGGTITFYSDAGATVGGNGILYVGRANTLTGTYMYSLNGGLLTVPQISHGGGNAVFNFNGGTLQAARANTNFMSGLTTANVQAGGAIINSNGNDIGLGQSLSHDASGPAIDGGLTKNGAGAMTVSGVSTYTGPTNINGGTLRLPSGAAQAAVGVYSFDNVTTAGGAPVSSGTVSTGYIVPNTGSGGSAMNGTVNDVSNQLGSSGGSIVPGKFGNALELDGLGSTVDIANKIVDQSGASSWTLSAWVKTTTPGSSILSKNTGTVPPATTEWTTGYSTFYLAGNPPSGTPGSYPTAVRYAGGFVQGNASVTDGNWHMVTFVDNAGSKSVYVDGVATTLNLAAFDNADTSTYVRLGYNTDTLANLDGNANYAGDLDEIKFFAGALAPSQVQQLFATNTVGNDSTQYLPVNTPVNITASGATLDLNSTSQTIGSLAGVSGSAVTLGGATLTSGGNGTSTAFAGGITGSGGIVKAGSGVWTLSGTNNYAGSTAVNGGVLKVTGLTKTASVSEASGAALDLGGKLVLDYSSTGVSPLPGILAQLQASRGSGAWAGTTGLISTAAQSDAKHITTIGYAEASQLLGASGGTWNGVAINGTSLILKYTYYGDLNLDGKINPDDYALIDRGYAKHLTGWVNGDVNYDGVINSADYLLMDTAFGKQTGVLSPDLLAERQADFGSAYVAALTAAVPEPASLGLLGLGLMALSSRRVRRRA